MAGPLWSDNWSDGICLTVSTPMGQFDILPILKRIGIKVDVIIVVYTVFRTIEPWNLDRAGCPVVLIAGDTQHGNQPLSTYLAYAQGQLFDFHLTGHGQQHAHWWASSPGPSFRWLPGQDANAYRPWSDRERSGSAVFIGSFSRYHPRRFASMQSLWREELPARLVSTSSDIASNIYSSVLLSLNFHLNGGMNARVFEVLGSSGALVSDRHEPQSGMGALFTEGQDYIGYDGDDELVEKVRYYLGHPTEALEIARNGHAKYLAEHTPARRIERFWEYIGGRSDELERMLDYEPRVAHAVAAGPIPRDILIERMRIYEYLQEQVRVRSGVRVAYLGGVGPVTIADTADLSRLYRAYTNRPDQAPEVWEKLGALGVATQVAVIHHHQILDEAWDLVVVGVDDFASPDVIGLLVRLEGCRVAIAGNGAPIPHSRRALLVQLGWDPDPEWSSLFRRPVAPIAPEPEPQPMPADDATGGVDALAQAHAAVVGFDWEGLRKDLPDDLNALIRTGVVASLEAGRPVDGGGNPIPPFTHGATEFLEAHLRPDLRAVIWGAGQDIGWWAPRVRDLTVILTPEGEDLAGLPDDLPAHIRVRVEDPTSATYTSVARDGDVIDLAVIGGDDVEACVGAVLGRLDRTGLVVIENADRQVCAGATRLLANSGWRRIDFWGLLPQYLFRGCTSIFFQDERYVTPTSTPDTHESTFGPSFAQITGQ